MLRVYMQALLLPPSAVTTLFWTSKNHFLELILSIAAVLS